MEYQQPLLRYPHSNNSLLSSGNAKKSTAYEPRTEAISPAINDDIIIAEDSTNKSTKDEQTLIVEKLKKVEAEIVQTDLQIVRLRRQKEQLEQAQAAPKHDEDQENVCDTKQLSIAKLVYHENRAKAQKAHAKLECLGGSTDLPLYNQPCDNMIYYHNTTKFSTSFKQSLIECFRSRFQSRLKLEDTVSTEYDKRMEKWLKSIEAEDSQSNKRVKDAKTREFFEKQFPELKKARESGERFSRVGQRVARSDAEVAELLDGITEREDQDKKVKSYAVIPPMLEEMRSKKPKFINTNGYVDDIVAEYKEYQILNTWTDEEKEIFRENYLQNPKNFALISRMTNRKNVANCVQYYYLSKKSENYKGLLKRQQKRRTRSFVRPAANTPANTEFNQNESNKTNGVNNDNQSGDNNNDLNGQNNGAKLSAPNEQSDIKKELLETNSSTAGNDQLEATCCICNCDFKDNNQFRNVTRSNHQLYGIGLEVLRPGMRICYQCRFRHVKHPNFDDSIAGLEPIDSCEIVPEQTTNGIRSDDVTMMDVDQPVIKLGQDELRSSQCNSIDGIKEQNNSTNAPHRLTNNFVGDTTASIGDNSSKQVNDPSNTNPNQSNKTPQHGRRVRDIIYQAIEMSFQDAPSGGLVPGLPINVKPQELKIENAPVDPMMTQHLMAHAPPPKPITLNHSIPNPIVPQLPIAPTISLPQQHPMHIEMQQKQRQLMDFNNRHQHHHMSLTQSQLTPLRHIPASQAPPLPQSIVPSAPFMPRARQQSPPMAHGVKDLRDSSNIDDGVLNLSAKCERPKSPVAVPVTLAAVPAVFVTAASVTQVAPVAATALQAAIPAQVAPTIITPASFTQTVAPSIPISVATTISTIPTTNPIPASFTSAPGPIPASAASTVVATSDTTASSEPMKLEPAISREDSRSPSEMVIDESADAPSPESASPKSDEVNGDSGKVVKVAAAPQAIKVKSESNSTTSDKETKTPPKQPLASDGKGGPAEQSNQ